MWNIRFIHDKEKFQEITAVTMGQTTTNNLTFYTGNHLGIEKIPFLNFAYCLPIYLLLKICIITFIHLGLVIRSITSRFIRRLEKHRATQCTLFPAAAVLYLLRIYDRSCLS